MSTALQQVSVLKSLESKMQDLLRHLKDPEDLWYPSDFLPGITNEGWHEQFGQIRKSSQQVRPNVLSVLVGNTLTEEALPSYMSWLNRIDGMQDISGTDEHPWAVWTRRWTAEEDRHGALLSAYLALNPLVDLRKVDRSKYALISSGFNPQTGRLPYQLLIYTSFQERATRVSHQNTGLLAGKDGDAFLEKICVKIAADEARHETFYSTLMGHVFDTDTNNAMRAYQEMMRQKVTMPGEKLADFGQFAEIAQMEGIYTAQDYANLITHQNKQWKIAKRTGLSPEAAEAQEYILRLPVRYQKLAERVEKKAKLPAKLPWIR